jgi:acyl-CoA thioesterase FadM
MGKKLWKTKCFGMAKRFDDSSRVEITNEDNARHIFDIMVVVHFYFIPQDQTVNHANYLEILKQLHEGVLRKRPELWPKD